MKINAILKWSRLTVSLLAIFVIAACSSQNPSGAVLPTSTQPAASPAIPNTGLATSTAAPAPVSTATVALPTLTTVPLATATQPAPTLPVATQAAAAAPECKSPAALTPATTEGPYFKANSPERASLLESGVTGTQLVLTGYVLTSDCQPVAHALVDFWQASAQGQYDNQGYTLRGHQFTDANGRYQLVTVNPGLYPGRTEHIHVKVQAPNGPVLTTQLFIPGVAANQSDSIFNSALLITMQSSVSLEQATFNFVIKP